MDDNQVLETNFGVWKWACQEPRLSVVPRRLRSYESLDDVIGYVVESGRKAVNPCVLVEKPASRR